MTNYSVSRNDLYQLDQQIIEMKKNQQWLAFLLARPIQQFYKQIEKELNITKARYMALIKKYCELDKDGNPIMETTGDKQVWKFKSSMKADDMTLILGKENVTQMWSAEVSLLMAQQVVIQWY